MLHSSVLTVADKPAFPAEDVEVFLRTHYGLDGKVESLPSEWDQNFLVDAGSAGRFIAKIANLGVDREVLECQNLAMDWVAKRWSSNFCPRVVASVSGDGMCRVRGGDGDEFWLRVLTYLEGRPLSSIPERPPDLLEGIGRALGELDNRLADFRHPGMDRELRWDLRRAEWIIPEIGVVPDLHRRAIVERLLLQYRGRIRPLLAELPMTVIHNDANDENLLVQPDTDTGWRVAGLLDFGDVVHTHTINELAIACAYACLKDNDDPLASVSAIASGYHAVRSMNDADIRVLVPLMTLRLGVSVTMSAIAAREDPDNVHKQITDRNAWAMLERLESVDWNAAEARVRHACGLRPSTVTPIGGRAWSRQELVQARERLVGQSLSLAYDTPLEIVRGRGQFLFDENGRAFLDCVNNVCHVGHSHPRVVEAQAAQAALLNTNTRYLHPHLVEYAERLRATLPDPLNVCFFVNSGSEANELAVRIARTYTGRRDAIVVDGAYHGNTATLVDLSPYKCEGPGGAGLRDWVHKVEQPDSYRGAHRGTGKNIGRAYAESVRDVCWRLEEAGHPPAHFIVESILGCAGQVVLPDGYLERGFDHVRRTGGLCIVDEVQVGFGRVGTHMWAFQTQDVVPDIVTMGKPIGNGHPIGAVVTTAEIAASFANGMEFFSTFGGNPVSCAVGMAVLDVIEEEGLQQRALGVGRYLAAGFEELGEKYTIIGDVRGLGLFMGVELVRDRETLEPATDETAELIERLKADGILLSVEGPFHNVLKIKPPLQFGERDADLLLSAVERVLASL